MSLSDEVDELLKDPEISEMAEEIEWTAWFLRTLGVDNNGSSSSQAVS